MNPEPTEKYKAKIGKRLSIKDIRSWQIGRGCPLSSADILQTGGVLQIQRSALFGLWC